MADVPAAAEVAAVDDQPNGGTTVLEVEELGPRAGLGRVTLLTGAPAVLGGGHPIRCAPSIASIHRRVAPGLSYDVDSRDRVW